MTAPLHLTNAARVLETILRELHPGQHFIVEVRDEDDAKPDDEAEPKSKEVVEVREDDERPTDTDAASPTSEERT